MASDNKILYVTVFDAEGNKMNVRPVDAREIVAAGGRYEGDKVPDKKQEVKQVHPAEKKGKK